jgi:hypothetical protein
MIFFAVSPTEPADVDVFRRLTNEALYGAYATVDPFDGKEHSYLELGAWIGDQGLAMQYMALGVMLGLFQLLSPITVLGSLLGLKGDEPIVMEAAQQGLLAVKRAE